MVAGRIISSTRIGSCRAHLPLEETKPRQIRIRSSGFINSSKELCKDFAGGLRPWRATCTWSHITLETSSSLIRYVREEFGAYLIDTLRLRGLWSKHCWFKPVCASLPAVFLVRRAFVVSVVDHSYLVTLLLLWPTMPSYPSTTLVVLAVGHVGGPAVRGYDDVVARSVFVISFFPPREDLVEAPDEGVKDEVLCLAAGSRADLTEQELGNCDAARVDLTKQKLGNYDAARVDPTEQEPGNCDVARVDPTEQELGNCDVARADLTERELGNYDVARVDPTEQKLGNCDAVRVDPTEQEPGNYDVAGVDPTEQELGNCDVARADL
ncbi:hypothetical protein BHM03_00013943, partial [Ensete ventricosum]